MGQAEENGRDVKQRLEKIEELEEDQEDILSFALPFAEQVILNGFIEFNYDVTDVEDTEDKDSGSSSDLYISSVELGLRIIFNEWFKTKTVVNYEDIGKEGDDQKYNLDEAIATMELPWLPVYMVGGKTELPFGVFEDHLISGTLTEDLYEIVDVGATIGLAPDFFGLDVSATIYEGQDIIDNLEDFGTHEYRPGRQDENGYDSYIANITIEPVAEQLFLSAYYENEPGDGRRNQSLGGSATVNIWHLTLDAEYITALSREKGRNDQENKESAWFFGLAWQPLEDLDLELASRYEDFYDDTPGDQDEVLDYSYLGGFNYAFFEFATFSVEYRYSKFEKEKGSEAADELNELFLQLSLGF